MQKLNLNVYQLNYSVFGIGRMSDTFTIVITFNIIIIIANTLLINYLNLFNAKCKPITKQFNCSINNFI